MISSCIGALTFQAGVGNSRLARSLAQYVLHALVQQCGGEIAHRFLLPNGKDSTGRVTHRHPLSIVSQQTVHTHRASFGRHDSTIGFACLAHLVGRNSPLWAIAHGPPEFVLSRLPTNPKLDYFRRDLAENFKVVLNPTYRIFLNFAKSSVLSCSSKIDNIRNFTVLFLNYSPLKL